MLEQIYVIRMRSPGQEGITVLAVEARLLGADLVFLNAQGEKVASFPLEHVESCEILARTNRA